MKQRPHIELGRALSIDDAAMSVSGRANEIQSLCEKCIDEVRQLQAQFEAQRDDIVRHYGERIARVLIAQNEGDATRVIPRVNGTDSYI